MILSRESGERNHAVFRDVGDFLRPRSLLVLNDTRVIPARLYGRKPSGGRIEVLLIERTGASCGVGPAWSEDWAALARSLGTSSVGTVLSFDGGLEAEILSRGALGHVQLRFRGQGGSLLDHVEQVGAIPLPPYIEAARKQAGMTGPELAADDRVRYQTVYAREPGAVAAPTAGLHFTEPLLAELQAAGHEVARVTLHVGPGTFRPVTAEDPRQHEMDAERFHVSEAAADAIHRAQADGRPVVAVGTTVVRTLETLARTGEIRAGSGSTRLYILPGEPFHVVTDLITNFHLPRSSLLMLVAAFAGHSSVLQAYAEAVRRGYRFYSYGDAMFIRPGRVTA